jgi:hypothetical protein
MVKIHISAFVQIVKCPYFFYRKNKSFLDHDELFFRNLLSEQVYVFFPFVKFSIVLQIRICGQAISNGVYGKNTHFCICSNS